MGTDIMRHPVFRLSNSKSSKIIKFLSLEFRSRGSGTSLAVSKKLHFMFDLFLMDLAHSCTTIDGGIWLFCISSLILNNLKIHSFGKFSSKAVFSIRYSG